MIIVVDHGAPRGQQRESWTLSSYANHRFLCGQLEVPKPGQRYLNFLGKPEEVGLVRAGIEAVRRLGLPGVTGDVDPNWAIGW